jgi:hypothetical protein
MMLGLWHSFTVAGRLAARPLVAAYSPCRSAGHSVLTTRSRAIALHASINQPRAD